MALGFLLVISCARVQPGRSVDAGQNRDSTVVANGPDSPPALPDGGTVFACGSGKALGNAGCSFYGVEPPLYNPIEGRCYAMFVVNPGTQAAHLTLTQAGTSYPLARVARLPRGGGTAITYQPFDAAAGLAPGGLVVVFLSGGKVVPGTFASDGEPAIGCPDGVESAVPDGLASHASIRGAAFHLSSDRPVVAYDMNPFGMALSHTPSASLLIPEEAWSTNNLVPTPTRTYPDSLASGAPDDASKQRTYVTLVAATDGTEVTIRPPRPVLAAPGVPGGGAGQTLRLTLDAGQYAQVSEADLRTGFSTGLAGTIVSANHPVLSIGGMPCEALPIGQTPCDSIHQQIPPFPTWGHEYAAVSYRSRLIRAEPVPWLIVGAVDGTTLTYAPTTPAPYTDRPVFAAPAPTRLAAGQAVQFWTADPFVVRSQDDKHPFYLAAQMTGGSFLDDDRTPENKGAGDPEFVNVIPLGQFLSDYTFFTDPTYSETNLVVVRKLGSNGAFADVKLDCARAPITGWADLGAGLQFARVDLVTGDFRPVIAGCDNGVNRMSSAAPFGLTVWGWGTSVANVPNPFRTELMVPSHGLTATSYGYPAGAGLAAVNSADLVIP